MKQFGVGQKQAKRELATLKAAAWLASWPVRGPGYELTVVGAAREGGV